MNIAYKDSDYTVSWLLLCANPSV